MKKKAERMRAQLAKKREERTKSEPDLIEHPGCGTREMFALDWQHIQVLATTNSFTEVIYIYQADSGLQQQGSVVVCSLCAISSLTYV